MAGLPLRYGETRYTEQAILNMSFVEKAGLEDVFLLAQLAYGLTSGNTPTPILVLDDGTVVTSGGGGATTVTSIQGTSPWLVAGSVSAIQQTDPWSISGSVGVTGGSVTAIQGTDPWTVDGMVGVVQVTDPWTIDGSVDVTGGSVTAFQGTDPWTVDGSVGVTGGTVTANQGTNPWVSQANVHDGAGTAIDSRAINDLSVPHNVSPPQALDSIAYLYGKDLDSSNWVALVSTDWADAVATRSTVSALAVVSQIYGPDTAAGTTSSRPVGVTPVTGTTLLSGDYLLQSLALAYLHLPREATASQKQVAMGEVFSETDAWASGDVAAYVRQMPKTIRSTSMSSGELSACATIYNATATTASSNVLTRTGFRTHQIEVALSSSSSPTRVKVEVRGRQTGSSKWFTLDYRFLPRIEWEPTEVASEKGFSYYFQGLADEMNILVTATGTTSANTFTISEMNLTSQAV